MKKKSTSQSAFFNLRVLIGAFFCLGAVSPAAAQCSWSAGPSMPTVLVRAVGVFFPADGNFYSVGGRTSDAAGSDFQHVLRYSPGSNSWTQTGVTLPDNFMNYMACGVLTVSGTPQIYCVGGSFATGTTATARVFSYNPATDTATTLTGDDWPGAMGTILPAGFAVANNKLYLLGGFNINVASTNQIWSFDPTAAVGAKWTLAPVTTPVGIMYAPTATIGGIIYVGGASDFQGGLVIDTTTSFSFNPATNTIGSIAPIPRATGETRGLTFCNKMYVMGGGRVAPNPSNEVDIYDPVSNSWTTGTPFVTGRRNFPTDTDSTNRIWLAGGYDATGVPISSMEIFNCPVSPCVSPTPTPTATATATPTATATATSTPVQIALHARGYKVHGLQKVDLFWSGPSSGFIDIYRDGVLVATVAAQSGFYTDNINHTGKGTYVYKVCVAGTGNCSNQVTVKFGGGG